MNQVCSFIYYRTTIIIGILFFFIGDDVFVDWEEEPLAPDDNKSLLTNNDGLSTIWLAPFILDAVMDVCVCLCVSAAS